MAMYSDIDIIMKSIEALTNKFGEVKKEVAGFSGQLNDHNQKISALAEDAKADREDVKKIIGSIEGRIDSLECLDNISEVVRDAIDTRLAEFGIDHDATGPGSLPSTSGSGSKAKENVFLLARRLLHIWPLDNPTVPSFRVFASRYVLSLIHI